jgi:hypothetical protein
MQRTESQGMQLAHQERDARREGGRGRATAAASGRQTRTKAVCQWRRKAVGCAEEVFDTTRRLFASR